MNVIFTILAAPAIGWFVKSRTGAVAIYLAAQSILFAYQSLAVLLAWMAAEGGFGGATASGAFGPAPTSFPIDYDAGEFWSYGLVNLGLIAVGLGIVLGLGHLRARMTAKRTRVAST